MCHHHRSTAYHHRAEPGHRRDPAPASDRRGSERVGDRDRETTATTLQTAAAHGLIAIDELEERLTATWSARTRDQLAAITSDLPRQLRDTAGRTPRQARVADTALRGSAAAFVAAIITMVSIWLVTGAGYLWPIWPAFGWAAWPLTRWIATCARRRKAQTTVPS